MELVLSLSSSDGDCVLSPSYFLRVVAITLSTDTAGQAALLVQVFHLLQQAARLGDDLAAVCGLHGTMGNARVTTCTELPGWGQRRSYGSPNKLSPVEWSGSTPCSLCLDYLVRKTAFKYDVRLLHYEYEPDRSAH